MSVRSQQVFHASDAPRQGNIRWTGLQIIAPPQHGKVRITGPSTYVKAPNRAHRGPDEFKMPASDSAVGLVIGTVVIMVQ